MNVVIRVDSSTEIGTGHVMRCATLAKQLKRHGVEVTFVCREWDGNSISYLESEEMSVQILSNIDGVTDVLSWTRDNWEMDAIETTNALLNFKDIDLLVIDHYSLDEKWESYIRRYTKNVVVIDDLADRSHDCDILLDQNYYQNMNSRYEKLVPLDCQLLLGPQYVLLREEFFEAAKLPRKRTGKLENILVFFGGTDPTGETLNTLIAIKELKGLLKNVDVVVGINNPSYEEIEKQCQRLTNTQFCGQVKNIAGLLMKADLAIGAGGTTTWERCFLGLPAVVIAVAENQKQLVKDVESKGAITIVDSTLNDVPKLIKEVLQHLVENPERLLNMSKRSSEIVGIKDVLEYPVLNILLGMIR